MDGWNLLLIVLIIAIAGFFVATEFAIVKVRTSRIDQLVAENKKGALAAKKIISNLDEYLSATQLGITITSLGLGWLGEPTVYHLIEPLLEKLNVAPAISNTIAFVIAFSFITFLHVVVGELAPKTLAIQKAEQVVLFCAKPLLYFYKITFPFIWMLNSSARFIAGLFGLKPASDNEVAHSEEELRLILSESYESGEINQTEFKYVNNIFEFDNRIAKEIMVPRTEIVGLYAEEPMDEHIHTIRNEKYTRYPVFGEDKDEILGMVNVKDFFAHYINEEDQAFESIQSIMRPVIEVMETVPIHDLLIQMQKKRIPLAVLYDEYGGTAGIVTLEDILEEIVGEIRDEYDGDEKPPIQDVNDDYKILDGKVLVSEVNDLLGVNIEEEDVDTIGGWILTQDSTIALGQTFRIDDWILKVTELDSHQIKRVEAKRLHKEVQVEVPSL
ncbi:hemolysin family protein [Ectobacillus sp. sgz5001026]|uniref:hemolysin family protein n=1 Tax=Ectobacillus sp. sgz5001026 TaxID=3242473 RepID=UPI0036D2BB63